MSKDTGLILRGCRYHYRRKVPLDLQPILGKREVKQSLKTSNFREAKRRRNKAAVELDELFTRARSQLHRQHPTEATRVLPYSPQEIEGRVIRFVEKTISDGAEEIRALATENEPEIEDDSTAAYHWQLENAGLIASYKKWSRENSYSDELEEEVSREIDSTVKELFDEEVFHRSLTPSEKSRAYKITHRALLEIASRERAIFRDAQQNHAFREAEQYRAFDPLFAAPESQLKTLASTCTDYLEDYLKTTPAGLKRTKRVRTIVALIQEFFGAEVLVSQITPQQARAFRDAIIDLPSNIRKIVPDRSIALKQAIEICKAQQRPSLERDTQCSYLHTFKKVLGFAVREGHISRNPAEGLSIRPSKVRRREKRLPFTTKDLNLIFHSPLYQSGIKGTRCWIPFIALFSGMRLNEICQLDYADVCKTPKGAWYFRVQEDEERNKRAKNEPSNRNVPIHPFLLRAGILDFVASKQGGRLFDDLTLSKDGYFSEDISKWFNRTFLKGIGVKRKKICFHSFRHCFKDALRKTDFDTDIHDEIGGWNTSKRTSSRYGDGYPVDQLREVVDKVSYPELDLSHLIPTKSDD